MYNQFMSSGDTVGSLSALQHAVLVGSLLGDGTLRRQGTRTNALFEVNHSIEFNEYVDWKYKCFQEFVLTSPKSRQGNGKRVAYRFTTRSLPVFTRYYEWYYLEGKKRVPRNLNLNSIILAVWFMDDGAKSRSALYLNTQQFCYEDQLFLQELLQKNFGIRSGLNRDKQYRRLRITTESTKVFEKIVRPHIIPCFHYKLHNDPVTTDPKGESSMENASIQFLSPRRQKSLSMTLLS
jgi:hypothetical protein